MAQPIPPRYSPAELIAELREAAEEIAPELNGIRPEETLEGESAQTLEEMLDALRRIADGAPSPQVIARATLDAKAPLRPFGKARKSAARPSAQAAPKAPGKPLAGKPPVKAAARPFDKPFDKPPGRPAGKGPVKGPKPPR